jgi:hypothetical protein
MGVFGKKSIAGMDRVHIRDFRRADNTINAKITFTGRSFADADGFVRELDVHGVGVGFRINRDGADVQFFAGADDPNGNFAAIGYQNFLKHGSETDKRPLVPGEHTFDRHNLNDHESFRRAGF